uniref:Uncharacterized protein n=1 Tax=Oryza sativa TaxID=4530 RepID=Q949E5_ORYSA|nr:putative protein [Oryza sativa]
MSNVVSGQQHARHDGEQGQAVGSSARAGRPSARTAAHGEVEGHARRAHLADPAVSAAARHRPEPADQFPLLAEGQRREEGGVWRGPPVADSKLMDATASSVLLGAPLHPLWSALPRRNLPSLPAAQASPPPPPAARVLSTSASTARRLSSASTVGHPSDR